MWFKYEDNKVKGHGSARDARGLFWPLLGPALNNAKRRYVASFDRYITIVRR